MAREIRAKSVGDARLELAVPVFGVRDLEESVRFYRDLLGFTVDWRWGEPPEMAAVSRDDIEIHLSAYPPGAEEHPSRIYCFVRGAETLARELRERGAPILHALAEQPYGMRDFDLGDPSGNVICFGEPTTE